MKHASKRRGQNASLNASGKMPHSMLREFKFELPSISSVSVLEVDADTVRNPQAKLEEILRKEVG